jgi:tRNA dimethylallyltransferase
MSTPAPREILLAGPTASGKSAVALCLAERLGGEIVSVDSMQVYRGLDIGTAKPSAIDRARVPHHLLDVVELSDTFDAARFARLARDAAATIRARGRVPILCGGSGLYFRAFLDGLGEAPPADPALRSSLESLPDAELLRELSERDPATFAKIDRQNRRRVVRAVEVIRLTGKPFAALQSPWKTRNPASPGEEIAFGLLCSGPDLNRRIETRVDEMFRLGLLEETRALLARGLGKNPTAMQALGYRQVVEHLRGLRNLQDTISLVKLRTRQFAKRQMTWFRRQMALHWIEVSAGETPEVVAEKIIGFRATRVF